MRANVSLKETVALRKYWFFLLRVFRTGQAANKAEGLLSDLTSAQILVFFGPLFFQKKVESFNMRPKAASHS
jgi:hypothetical protein